MCTYICTYTYIQIIRNPPRRILYRSPLLDAECFSQQCWISGSRRERESGQSAAVNRNVGCVGCNTNTQHHSPNSVHTQNTESCRVWRTYLTLGDPPLWFERARKHKPTNRLVQKHHEASAQTRIRCGLSMRHACTACFLSAPRARAYSWCHSSRCAMHTSAHNGHTLRACLVYACMLHNSYVMANFRKTHTRPTNNIIFVRLQISQLTYIHIALYIYIQHIYIGPLHACLRTTNKRVATANAPRQIMRQGLMKCMDGFPKWLPASVPRKARRFSAFEKYCPDFQKDHEATNINKYQL